MPHAAHQNPSPFNSSATAVGKYTESKEVIETLETSMQTNELADTEALDLLVGQLVSSESAVQTLWRALALILVNAMQHAQVNEASQVSSGGHTRDQCRWV